MDIRKIIAIVLLIVIAVFVVMNLEDAKLWLFGIRAEMPIALLVLVSAALGFCAGMLLAFMRQKKPAEKKGPVA